MDKVTTPPAGVTSLDVLKCVAVALMLADHVGLYLLDTDWLRVAGRPVAVIFGFLIGFSSSKRVPPSWVGLGIALTLANRWMFPDDTPHTLDILLTLALTRIAIPIFERLHDIHPLTIVLMIAALGLATGTMDDVLEYGTEVPIMAALGVAVRLDRGTAADRAARGGAALAALVVISLAAISFFEFSGVYAAGTVATLAATMLVLERFRITDVPTPAALVPLVRWTGRHTLYIYAAHLLLLQIAVWAVDPEAGQDAEAAH